MVTDRFTSIVYIAPVSAPVTDSITKSLTEQEAMNRGMETRGYSKVRQLFGFTTEEDAMEIKYDGGYRDEDFLKKY